MKRHDASIFVKKKLLIMESCRNDKYFFEFWQDADHSLVCSKLFHWTASVLSPSSFSFAHFFVPLTSSYINVQALLLNFSRSCLFLSCKAVPHLLLFYHTIHSSIVLIFLSLSLILFSKRLRYKSIRHQAGWNDCSCCIVVHDPFLCTFNILLLPVKRYSNLVYKAAEV